MLWEHLGEDELTTIGHKLREAMQAFASDLVSEHRLTDVDPDPSHARARLGAVIAVQRENLGEARRKILEALGDLWEATDTLVQRQEHGATKEGEPAHLRGWASRSCPDVFLMIEFVETFDDMPVGRHKPFGGGALPSLHALATGVSCREPLRGDPAGSDRLSRLRLDSACD